MIFFRCIPALPTDTLEARLNALVTDMGRRGYTVGGSPANVADRQVAVPFELIGQIGSEEATSEWVEELIQQWEGQAW